MNDTGPDANLEVVDVPELERYELRAGGEVRGHLRYRRHGDLIILVHTEVDPSMQGRGAGALLARTALDNARDNGDRVVPRCAFVKRFIGENPQYAGLVAGSGSTGSA